jgi:VWFA-related protein
MNHRPSHIGCRVFLVLVAAATFSAKAHAAYAQEQTPVVAHPLETTTELVKVDVSVLNAQGDFADGLEESSFRVRDDGVERPIAFFAPVTAPAKVVMVLETSPAVYLFEDEHLAAAYMLLGGLASDDEVALITYADMPRQIVGFTSDKQQLASAMENVQYTLGAAALNLYDSVSAVLDGLTHYPGKKAIVLLTTGLDSSPPERWDALVKKLRGSDVLIFSVGLGGILTGNAPQQKASKKSVSEHAQENSAVFERARTDLTELSALTGGQAYFPETAKDFAPAYREIASLLRHEYVLGIAPGHDGRVHKLSVEVVDPSGKRARKKHGMPAYRVAAREGYIAPQP